MEQEAKKPPIFYALTQEFPTRSMEDVLNLQEFTRERDLLQEKKTQTTGKLISSAQSQLPDQRSHRELGKLVERNTQIHSARVSLLKKIQDNPEKTLRVNHLASLVYSAASLLLFDNIERQKKFAQRYNFSYFFEERAQIDQFEQSGELYVKIAGVSIKDAIDNPTLSPASIYRLFVEAHRELSRRNHAKILEENQTPMLTTYPNIAKYQIETAAAEAVVFSDTNPEEVEIIIRDILPNAQGTETEVLEKVKAIVKYTHTLRQKIFNTIFDPESSGFPDLKNAVEKYLKEEDNEIKIVAIEKLGLNTAYAISLAYRMARVLSEEKDDNSSFYERLSASIRELVEEIPFAQLLTKDDLVSLLYTSISLDDSTIPTPEDLRESTTIIYKKSSRKEYTINPQDINWKSLVSPTSVKVMFSENPSTFNVFLHYQNEAGEVLDVPLTFDVKKGQFDLGFMESSNDPDMKDMGNAVLLAAQAILLDVQKQAESEYQEKQKERHAKTQTPQATMRQSRPKEPYVPREREKRQGKPKPLSPIQEVLQSEVPFPIRPEQQRIKNQLVLSPHEELDKMTKNLSEEDRALAIKGIEGYNQRGVGQFKRQIFWRRKRALIYSKG